MAGDICRLGRGQPVPREVCPGSLCVRCGRFDGACIQKRTVCQQVLLQLSAVRFAVPGGVAYEQNVQCSPLPDPLLQDLALC